MKYSLILLLTVALFACDSDTTAEPNVGNDNSTVWDGATITFSKAVDADPTVTINQDRLTDDVWLTRGNDGGQIYNAAKENDATKDSSPSGTRWAIGTIEERATLDFQPFRAAVGSPKSVVGKDLVLYLVDEDAFVSLKFTEWSQQKGGGFAYERSAEN